MSKIFCATFADAAHLKQAVKALREKGISNLEVFSPYPIHGIDAALGYKRSPLGIFPLIGGTIGFFSGMAMSWWMGSVDYRLIVAGMPFFSWVFTFPIAYELTILFGAFSTLIGMFLMNRLPRPHNPIFEHSKWKDFTNDKLLLAICESPTTDFMKLTSDVKVLGAIATEEIAGE